MAPEIMTSSPRPPSFEDDGDDDYAIAAAILAVILICIIIAVVLCSFWQRRADIWYRCRRCLCPCSKTSLTNEDLAMGYLPAHITVNPGALQQGVPDIFLRDSQAGRISVEGNSYGSWRGGGDGCDSVTETSVTWADYLRRATTIRRRSSPGDRGGKSSGASSGLPSAEPGVSETDVDNVGISDRALVMADVSNGRGDVMMSGVVRDDVMNDAVCGNSNDKDYAQ